MVAMAVGGRTGQPYPSNTRIHRSLSGAFKEGATFLAATDISLDIPIAGDNLTRIYFKADQAGTLKFAFVRPYPSDAVYDTVALADAATTLDVESIHDIVVRGESRLKLTFTPGATPGAITYANVSHNEGN